MRRAKITTGIKDLKSKDADCISYRIFCASERKTTKGSVNDRNTSYKEKTEGNVIAVQCVVEALHVTYSVQHVMLPSL